MTNPGRPSAGNPGGNPGAGKPGWTKPAAPKAAVPKPGVPKPAVGARTYAPDFLQEMFANPLDAGYSDAAERRARLGPPPATVRRTGFLLRMIALVATGLLLTVAYRETIAAKPEVSAVRSGLANDVRSRQSQTDQLQRDADALRIQVTKLRDAALGSSDAQALRDLEAQTGLGAVTGPGTVVTMADAPAPTDPVTGQPDGANLGQIYDADLQIVCNELWHDGAEAIAINGQRLTATSAIRLAGSAILVDFTPLSQPYKISAIGPDSLGKALAKSATGQLYERYTNTLGMHFSIADDESLTLPAASEPQLKYATSPKPATKPSPSPGSQPSGAPPSGKPANPPASPAPSATSTGGR